MIRSVLTITLFVVSTSANGSVYKCTAPDGSLTFSDKPCPGQTNEEVQVRDAPPNSAPAPGYDPLEAQKRMAEEWDRKREAETRANLNRRSQEVSEKKARDAEAKRIRDARISDRIVRGMSADDVRNVLGRPDKVNPSSGGREQWVYYESSGTDYVHLRNGEVTSWSRYNR